MLFFFAKEKTGLEMLRTKLSEVSGIERLNANDVIITNARHYDALLKVSESLERVIKGLDNKVPEDLLAIDKRQAIHYLG